MSDKTRSMVEDMNCDRERMYANAVGAQVHLNEVQAGIDSITKNLAAILSTGEHDALLYVPQMLESLKRLREEAYEYDSAMAQTVAAVEEARAHDREPPRPCLEPRF